MKTSNKYRLSERQIQLNGTAYPYKLTQSSRKSIVIQVKPDGSVHVRAPFRVSVTEIERFLHIKKDWLTKTVSQALAAHSAPPVQFENGERFRYLGNEYILECQEATGRKENSVGISEDRIVMTLTQEMAITKRQDLMEQWYRQQAQRVLTAKADIFAGILKVKYVNLRINNPKTRWGSCSSQGNLNFNWHIVMAPEAVVDYLVIHELCHLLHMNHSELFWKSVEGLCPDYKNLRKWLKTHGSGLKSW